MKRTKGTHVYIDVTNINAILSEEAQHDDDLKRTIHRLHTYFAGLTQVIKKYGGTIEKYTGARAHAVFTDDVTIETVLKTTCACFVYTYDIFNCLGKYSLYTPFKISVGADHGSYYEHTIELPNDDQEYTTIGAVANNSAKLQAVTPAKRSYITERLYNLLPQDIKEKFTELTDDEYEVLEGRISDFAVYQAHYRQLVTEDTLDALLTELESIREKVKKEANSLNLAEMSFEGVRTKVSFERLSRSVNKSFEGVVLCADLRGFTKLFADDDSNLTDLVKVIAKVFESMQASIAAESGTRVQFQGDRIVSIFNDFGNEPSCVLRALQAAMSIKKAIAEIDKEEETRTVLGADHLSIGIGCSHAKTLASRLGMKKNRDNIVLGDAPTKADKAEDRYAKANEIVVDKETKELLASIDAIEANVLSTSLTAISTTGFYLMPLTLAQYQKKVDAARKEAEAAAGDFTNAQIMYGTNGKKNETWLRPWRE